jgi:hypothetical protein
MPVYDDDHEEQQLRKKTVYDLSQFLSKVIREGVNLEMFLCWEGDQSVTPVARKTLSPDNFLNAEFPLAENEFANITA